jgi:lipid A disaccharide synthetase
MLAHGLQSWWPQEKLAVRGYVEVLRHYAEIAGIRRQLKARLLREWPSCSSASTRPISISTSKPACAAAA